MRREQGSATVQTAVLVVLLTTVALVAVAITGVIAGERRAAAAADLAALAAASALQQSGRACPAAARIATANHARLRSCDVDGEEVRVEVTVGVPSLFDRTWEMRAQARAGPVA